jgi:vacuolar protein sorting-associated protein 26
MQSLFGLVASNPVDMKITLADEERRKWVDVRLDRDKKEKFPLYFDGEPVRGKARLLYADYMPS